jgi:hypothetical protein
MKSSLRTACLLAVAAIVLKGCIFNPSKDDPGIGTGDYKAPTSPENLIANLIESYDRKEIEEYAKLLAPEFIFKFQPADLDLIEDEFWTRDQDSTGTAGLFGTADVGDIRINLIHGPAEEPAEIGFDEGVLTIRINPTQLEVDQIGGDKPGTTYQVDGDIQDMFFRRGNAEAGEDTTRWFIIEWRDIPNPAAAPRTVQPASAGEAGNVQTVSWGRMLHEMSQAVIED